jgi:hypothetical protein
MPYTQKNPTQKNPTYDSFKKTKKSPFQSKLKRASPTSTALTSGRQSGLAGTRKSERL